MKKYLKKLSSISKRAWKSAGKFAFMEVKGSEYFPTSKAPAFKADPFATRRNGPLFDEKNPATWGRNFME